MAADAAAAGAPGASQMAPAAGAAQPGVSMGKEAVAGAAAQSAEAQQLQAGATADSPEAKAVAAAMAAASGTEKGETTLVAGKGGDKTAATLTAEAGKTKGAETAAEAGEAEAGEDEKSLWSGAKEDEELVDPDADRPDFGSSEEAAEEEGEDDEDAEEDDDEEDEKKSSKPVAIKPERHIDPAYITAGLMVLAVGCVATVLWLQRANLSRMWPGFDAIYSKMGLEAKKPGDGLRLTQSGMRLLRIGGIETLVVKGYISNIAGSTVDVPKVRLQLVDATNTVVQEATSSPAQPNLASGASMDFEVRLELPNMAAAKSVVVNWGE